MLNLLIRLGINAVALWVAAAIVPGIFLTNDLVGIFVVALIFGVVNAVIKPVVQALTCPFYFFTLGLISLLINALMLLLTGFLTDFAVSGTEYIAINSFWAALGGGIVIGVVSFVLSIFLPDPDDRKRRRRR